MSLPRLAGPRLLLLPAPRPVAQAVATGGDVHAPLSVLGLSPGAGWPHPDSADALRPLLASADGDLPVWLLVDGAQAVGEAGVTGPVSPDGDLEICYGLAAPFRGQGLGTEAVAVLCAWAERQPGVRRVVAEVLVGNEASQRLLGRLGFVPEPGTNPYERWARAAARSRPARRIAGRHVC